MTPRLRALLDCVEKCKILADIGTDHAYLPIEAIRKNICERAIACDIVPGPLNIASQNIRAAGLQARIETRLGDGLNPLSQNEADCIVIAGMGGMNIINIISAAQKKCQGDGSVDNAPRLILQPQHDLEELRRFLHKNLYNIIEEKLIRERERFYVILISQRANENEIATYTDAEYFTGKIISPHFTDYLREKHKKISGYINSVSDEKSRELAKKQMKWLEEANVHNKVDN